MALSGSPLNSLAVSTDESPDNLVELRDDVVATARYNPGRRSTRLPHAGEGQVGHVQSKAEPSVSFECDPSDTKTYLAMLGTSDGPKYIEFKLTDDDEKQNNGLKVSGLAIITDDGLQHSVNDNITTMGFTLYKASGAADWVRTNSIA